MKRIEAFHWFLIGFLTMPIFGFTRAILGTLTSFKSFAIYEFTMLIVFSLIIALIRSVFILLAWENNYHANSIILGKYLKKLRHDKSASL